MRETAPRRCMGPGATRSIVTAKSPAERYVCVRGTRPMSGVRAGSDRSPKSTDAMPQAISLCRLDAPTRIVRGVSTIASIAAGLTVTRASEALGNIAAMSVRRSRSEPAMKNRRGFPSRNGVSSSSRTALESGRKWGSGVVPMARPRWTLSPRGGSRRPETPPRTRTGARGPQHR